MQPYGHYGSHNLRNLLIIMPSEVCGLPVKARLQLEYMRKAHNNAPIKIIVVSMDELHRSSKAIKEI